jgi:hypothetical protein
MSLVEWYDRPDGMRLCTDRGNLSRNRCACVNTNPIEKLMSEALP